MSQGYTLMKQIEKGAGRVSRSLEYVGIAVLRYFNATIDG